MARHDLDDRAQAVKSGEAQECAGRAGAPEARVAALEKAQLEEEALGEFESEGPGYCGAQAPPRGYGFRDCIEYGTAGFRLRKAGAC